jgi:cobalt-zinc-cadmium efflux system outer membrane protein
MFRSKRPVPAAARLALSILILCPAAPLRAAHENDAARPLTLEGAVRQALADNPGLAEIKARAEAVAAVPPQAGSLPDPVLSVETLNLPVSSFDFREDSMTMVDVGLSQTLPFPGKLTLRERAAGFEAEAAAETVAEARLRLARDIKLRWWQLFYMEQTLHILGETETHLRDVAEAVLARYRVGEARQEEVLQAQLEVSKLGEERLIHTAMHHREVARLNALLDRPPTEFFRLSFEEPGELPEVVAEENLDRAAEASRPLLAQKRNAVDAAESRVELARKDYYPDLTVSAGYAFRDRSPTGEKRSDFLRFGVSLNLPVYAGSKQAKAVDQQQSEWLREKYGLQDALRKVQADIAAALSEYRRAKDHYALLRREVIPLAEQTVASLRAGFEVGRTNLADLLRATASLREAEIRAWQSYAEAQQSLARLAAAAGREAL